MIVVDSSALVAIVFGEPELQRFSAAMAAEPCAVSAASVFEAAMVVEARQGPDAVRDLQSALERSGAEVHPIDAEVAWAAHAAWQRFGKGRHPAGLNFGDCLSYATAKLRGVPLLFKGDDFEQTDIARAG